MLGVQHASGDINCWYYSFTKYLLTAYCVSIPVLGTGNKDVCKTYETCPGGAHTVNDTEGRVAKGSSA